MNTGSVERVETSRLRLQAQLDAKRTQRQRNELGQFATPPTLAEDILRCAAGWLPAHQKIRFLDPAVGTGAFYAALRSVIPATRIGEALGFEIDPHYGEPAAALWRNAGLDYRIADFTLATAMPRFNLLVCNPPYVRHHHLRMEDKARLQSATRAASGLELSGLSGLYCHFLGLSHAWMADGGLAGWLIPSEFMDVNYGRALARYLLDVVTLLHIHRFDPSDVQFADALVSSAVIWFRKARPPKDHDVRFTFGGTLAEPRLSRQVAARALAEEPKWTRFPIAGVRKKASIPTIADFFSIKRGVATGGNRYFILSADQMEARHLPREAFRLILPSPRHLPDDRIEADERGCPRLSRQLFLLDTSLTELEIERRHPALFAYLQEGRRRALPDRYLCRHRSLWYAQESRPAAPILCTYLGRGSTVRKRPFRFILNRSEATAANVYLMMYPTPPLAGALARDPSLIERVWEVLNEITAVELLGQGRVYGGGLHKLEPRELASVRVPRLMDVLPADARPAKPAAPTAEIAA